MIKMYEVLDNRNREEALAFLSREPDQALVMIRNIHDFGMEPGDTGFHGTYFGKRDGDQMVAIGAVYRLGSFFLHARSSRDIDGMGECVRRLGLRPDFIGGRKDLISRLLDDLGELPGFLVARHQSEHLLLPLPMRERFDTAAARPAADDDLDILLEMSIQFHSEAVGMEVTDVDSIRELLLRQVRYGAASVVDLGGTIVSKAEATVLEGVGAHVGGVYTPPEFRGRGYSTTCMVHLCGSLPAEVPAATLIVDKENYPARHVYHKIGFDKTGDWMFATIAPI